MKTYENEKLRTILEEQAKNIGVDKLNSTLARKTGDSREAISSGLKRLAQGTDNLKLFRKYMEALNLEFEVIVKIKE